ncbi:MAG: hypothetical protein ABH824_06240 [Nanoarchaeota archaeon]|nr:hypothetical protein [Nanoarchaeota archaeon]MBU1632295.1 hypothetical protein [Nanoarchaeota archaeon]MBU1875898.1 hypothetical protein [Nanoarchaeota archaeon]
MATKQNGDKSYINDLLEHPNIASRIESDNGIFYGLSGLTRIDYLAGIVAEVYQKNRCDDVLKCGYEQFKRDYPKCFPTTARIERTDDGSGGKNPSYKAINGF